MTTQGVELISLALCAAVTAFVFALVVRRTLAATGATVRAPAPHDR